jgi:hypothetical protein
MCILHVPPQLLAVVEALTAELAQGMSLEVALRQRACLIALPVVAVKLSLGVQLLLTYEHLPHDSAIM